MIWRRTAATVVMTVAWLGALTAPAEAHTVAGVGSTNLETVLTDVAPSVDGVVVEVIESGSRLEVTNGTDEDLIVIGYSEEPYLRVGPEGVFENRRSPATYLNASRQGEPQPANADPSAPPEWQKVSDGHVARFHDHRIHYMGEGTPKAAQDSPDERILINEWTVPMRLGVTSIEVSGTLTWVPGPGPIPWALLSVVLFGVAVATAFSRRWAVLLAAVVVLVLAVDVVHAVGVAFESAGSTGARVAEVFTNSAASVVAWMAGIAAIGLLLRRRLEGAYLAAATGLVIAIVGGVVDVGALYRSQVPFAWSSSLARLLVAASLGLGFGTTLAVVLLVRRQLPVVAVARPHTPAPQEVER